MRAYSSCRSNSRRGRSRGDTKGNRSPQSMFNAGVASSVMEEERGMAREERSAWPMRGTPWEERPERRSLATSMGVGIDTGVKPTPSPIKPGTGQLYRLHGFQQFP